MKRDNDTSREKMELIHVSATLEAGNNRQILATTRGHTTLMDIRKEWGGDDVAPTPPECMAIALGGCIFNVCRIMALEQQIQLNDLRISVAGDADPSRAFGLETDARAGFSKLSVNVSFSSDLSVEKREKFLQELLYRCPLCDTVNHPTPLQIQFV
jgi:putative redox protein